MDALAVGLRFQWMDVEVASAVNAETGLRAFRERQPDLVVLEVDLPDESGYEVVREIRQESDVPVVMLAAEDGDADEVRGFEMGADGYLLKPFGLPLLLARIKAVLRRTNMHPPARIDRAINEEGT